MTAARVNSVSEIYKFERRPDSRSFSTIKSGEGGGLSQSLLPVLNISVPVWWRDVVFGEEGLGRWMSVKGDPSGNVWNCLVSLSWRFVKSRKLKSFVPRGEFIEFIDSKFSENFGFGKWFEVVASNRSKKTSGVSTAVVNWIIERDVRNYCVLFVEPRRTQALAAYRYLLGASARLYSELRRSGVKISRGDFFKRIRVRLYLGGEMSCLLNRSRHFIEDCIKSCPLFQRYGNKWRKVPPVPVMDSWMLKLAGYCPKIAASSKSFWYNSIVVVTKDALPLAVRNIVRHGIRNVVLVFDEFLIHLKELRGMLMKLDVKRLEKILGDVLDEEFEYCGDDGCYSVSLRDAVNAWNRMLEGLDRELVEVYGKEIDSDVRGQKLGYFLIERFCKSVVDVYGSVREYLLKLFDISRFALDVSKRIDRIDRRMRVKRLGLWMLMNVLSSVVSVEYGGAKGRIVHFRWRRGGNGEERLVSWYGGGVRGVISYLDMHRVNVGVVTISVDDSEVRGFRVAPHESVDRVEIRLDVIRKYVKSGKFSWSPRMFYPKPVDVRHYYEWYRECNLVLKSKFQLMELVQDIVKVPDNVVIVANKRVVLYLAELFKELKYKVEIYGELNRGVVDYVLIDKGNGKIMLVSPHSRAAYGVDPPVENPKVIILLYGVRRPTREYIKLPRDVYHRLVYYDPDLGLMDYSVMRERDTYYVAYDDGENTILYVYDEFDAKYDRHMLVQIIGRWYMQNVGLILYNYKYDDTVFNLKYYAIDVDWLFGIPRSSFYIEHEVREKGRKYIALEPVKSFDDAIAGVVKYEKRDVVGSVLRYSYARLRSVYNSFRYVKKQLRHRRLHDGDLWLLTKKIVAMLNGFKYAEENGLNVPEGLRRFYYLWRERGVEDMLEELKKWLGVVDWEWMVVVRRLVYVYSVKCPWLEYRYGLRRVPRNVVVIGVNDSGNKRLSDYVSAGARV